MIRRLIHAENFPKQFAVVIDFFPSSGLLGPAFGSGKSAKARVCVNTKNPG
jgi:hypothetical protein